ncbi:hypothetical protein N7462_009889 [Penicillium macrosclerotiorum]|uniref:uncharacterized protein n=1 Tax=Penicillium macrosclerotiorum TaxID=303699 RepID=UPI002547E087|nr:uncharacterized protein N7462_009889 [Penicillium macrosclerotiorum]KAJ5668819.1 hypothetical protein N7462_009889 [Penicillium macrosclerotiorum]
MANMDAATHGNPNEVAMGRTQATLNQEQPEQSQQAVTPGNDGILSDAPAGSGSRSPAKKTAFNFLDLLTSPSVEIVVGQGDNETILNAHQNLLLDSPYLAKFIYKFEDSSPVRFLLVFCCLLSKTDPVFQHRINLPDEDVEAFVSFLEFQYTRDYTVKKQDRPSGSEVPEGDFDQSGEELLQHERIYTLAETLRMPALKSLVHTKIHHIKDTPKGELAYARYVYAHTTKDEIAIRKPVASYWASRGHILHEIQKDWAKLCHEVPEFTFDVLTMLMDRREKPGQSETESSPRGRKRLRAADK